MVRKKTLAFAIALSLVAAMVPQSIWGASAAAFSERPAIETRTCSTTSVKVRWKKIKGADGYQVYRALPGKSFYKVKTVKAAKVQYLDKNLKSNTKYYYKVRGYKVINGKKTYGKFSWSKVGNAGIPQGLKGFSAYTSDKDHISVHWRNPGDINGVFVYRSDSQQGAYEQIAKVPAIAYSDGEYDDGTVEAGKIYYYKARPYITYDGKVIKGKFTKASAKTAMHYNVKAADVTVASSGTDEKELIFRITMEDYSFDTEFFIVENDEDGQGTIELQQTWTSGTAKETRQTTLKVTGLSFDGNTYQETGSVKVGQGKTIYIKASAGEPIVIGTGETLNYIIYCHYNGSHSAVDSYDD